MANDIIDINVTETVETIEITVNPNLTTVNINQVTGGGGGGITDLGYIATPTNGTVTSSTGSSAVILLADGTNAGLITPAEKTKIANSVPYTGATSDVNLGEFGIQLGNLEFDNTPTNIPTTAGSMYYNDADGTLDLILKGGNVTLQIGQEQVVRVVNKTATNIDLLESNYQAVRITGAQGQRMKVDLAQATNDVLSAETIGLVTETIANNAEGFITTSGIVRGINTTGSLQSETWLDGDILYLSPTVAGRITKVKPTAPNHLIIIGYVIYAHITQGTIFVKVDNGYELDELHNVKIDTATNNEVLAYTSATDIWENKTPSEAGLQPTLVSATNIKTINGNTILGSGDLTISGTGISSLNGLTGATQTFSVFTNFTGSPSFSSTGTNHQLRLPNAGVSTDYGLVTNVGQTFSGTKVFANSIEIPDPVPANPIGIRCIVLGDPQGQLIVGSTTTYPDAQEMQHVKGVTSNIQTQLDGKQATLTAGNGIDITTNTISTVDTSRAAYTILANNTNAAAVPTTQVYKDIAEQTYSGTIIWSTTAPTTILSNTYRWNQVGSLVTVRLSLSYSVAGSNTQVIISLPTDLPTPSSPTGFTGASDILYYGTGSLTTTTSLIAATSRVVLLRRNAANNGYEFVITISAAVSIRVAHLTLQYFT